MMLDFGVFISRTAEHWGPHCCICTPGCACVERLIDLHAALFSTRWEYVEVCNQL